jgi:hypothetical protein
VDALFGKFAEGLKNRLLVVYDEADSGRAINYNATIKTAITNATIVYECKGIQAISLQNCANYVFLTNDIETVKIESSDRRFVVMEACADHANDPTYFEPLFAAMDDAHAVQMLYQYLLKRDIGSFDPVRDRPMTEAYRNAKAQSMPLAARFVLDYLDNLESRDVLKDKPVIVYTDTLYSAFDLYLHRGYGNVKWTREKFGIEVMAVISKKETIDGQLTEMMKGRKKVNGRVQRYYVLDIDHIRSKMAKEGYIEAFKPTVLSTHEHLDVIDDDLY